MMQASRSEVLDSDVGNNVLVASTTTEDSNDNNNNNNDGDEVSIHVPMVVMRDTVLLPPPPVPRSLETTAPAAGMAITTTMSTTTTTTIAAIELASTAISTEPTAIVDSHIIPLVDGDVDNVGDAVAAHQELLITAQVVVDIETGGGLHSEDLGMIRGEFISVTIIKKTADSPVGIRIGHDNDGDVSVFDLTPTGCLIHSPIKAGDKLISVNGKSCSDMDKTSVVELLRQATGFVTIIAHNRSGRSNVVEIMLEKPSPSATVGIGMRFNQQGSLEVSKILENGLFAHSLLNVGDRVLAINSIGCQRMDPRCALDIIRNSRQYVTVMSATHNTTGVVVATAPEGEAALSAAAAAEATSEDGITNVDVSSFREQACFCTWMLIISLLFVSLAISRQGAF